jgi:Domain of unknown function (DUF4251)
VVKNSEIGKSKTPCMLFNKSGRLLILLLACISLHSSAQSGDDQKKTDIKSIVQSRNYSFSAQSATTNKGKTIQLSYGYDLKLINDSLYVYLPYYGRAYNTAYSSNSDNGIQFSSHDFIYSADSTKKQSWEITIKPKGAKVSAIYLSITSTGYCTVRINSNDRDPISYYGTIKGGAAQ